MSEKQLLQEFTLLEYNPDDVKRSLKLGKNVILSGIIQRAGIRNANNRIYPRNILEREIDKFHQMIKERRALGELDHPESALVNLRNVSHRVNEIYWDGDDLKGKIEILNTSAGKELRSLVEDNVLVGISSRGLGSTTHTNEGVDLVNDDFQLVAFDVVSNPSTFGSFISPLKESREYEIREDGRIRRLFEISRQLDELIRG